MEVSNQLRLVAGNFEDGSFSQGEDWRDPGYLMVLLDPLLSGLPLVGGGGVRVNVVRVDVEGYEVQGLEGWRVHYRHVVGRVDADSAHVGPGTAANVGDALVQHLPRLGCFHYCFM